VETAKTTSARSEEFNSPCIAAFVAAGQGKNECARERKNLQKAKKV